MRLVPFMRKNDGGWITMGYEMALDKAIDDIARFQQKTGKKVCLMGDSMKQKGKGGKVKKGGY